MKLNGKEIERRTRLVKIADKSFDPIDLEVLERATWQMQTDLAGARLEAIYDKREPETAGIRYIMSTAIVGWAGVEMVDAQGKSQPAPLTDANLFEACERFPAFAARAYEESAKAFGKDNACPIDSDEDPVGNSSPPSGNGSPAAASETNGWTTGSDAESAKALVTGSA